jgi:hypothetical protein
MRNVIVLSCIRTTALIDAKTWESDIKYCKSYRQTYKYKNMESTLLLRCGCGK